MCHAHPLPLQATGRYRDLAMPGLDPGIHGKKASGPRRADCGAVSAFTRVSRRAMAGNDGEWASADGHRHHSITPSVGASGAGIKSRPSAYAVRADRDQLEYAGWLDRSGTPEDVAHASNAIGLDDHCSGYPQFDASLLRSGPRAICRGTRITCTTSFIQLSARLGACGRAPRPSIVRRSRAFVLGKDLNRSESIWLAGEYPSTRSIETIATPHSVTSSARASRAGGMSMPSALAVLRLMARSNFVGDSTGKSPGLVPCKIRCT